MNYNSQAFTNRQRIFSVVSYAILTLVIALNCSAVSQAQQAEALPGREQRSPWRASFTEINKGAADQLQAQQGPGPGWQAAQARAQDSSSSRTNVAANQTPALNPRIADVSSAAGSGSRQGTGSQQSGSGSRQNSASSAGSGSRKKSTAVAGAAISRSMNALPNEAGQVWREYDISSYTSKVTSVDNPQQALLDWILRETGNEMWFNEPLGILHATKSRLIVYHTPEIQTAVKDIVDRFVRTRGQLQSFNINLVTVGNPNWRAAAYPLLQTVDVKSPGVEAWLISKENAAILFNQLKNRTDFKEHSGGTVNTHDGQSFVIEKTKSVPFVRSIRWTPGQLPGYEPLMTTINEGYTVGLSPLMSLDNQSVEIAIKADVDQVESLTPVRVPVGGANNTVNNVNLNVPKVVSWRLHERFRWPSDQVLLVSSCVVADPQPESGAGLGPLRSLGLSASQKKASRSDALLMIEYRGPSNGASLPRSAGRSRMQPLTNR